MDNLLVDKIVDNVLQYWDKAPVISVGKGSEHGFQESEEEPASPIAINEIDEHIDGETDPKIDRRFEEAARFVVATQSGLRSDLQRNLALGYARAGRILNQLESAGIVGPENGKEAREVLVNNTDELEQILSDFCPLQALHTEEFSGRESKVSVEDVYKEMMHEE